MPGLQRTRRGLRPGSHPDGRRTGDGHGEYRITGQKIWTSLAHEADWCFVLARTEPGSTRHHGLSFLLVPMDQPGRVEVRPIRQLTGTSEFNEVFFDGAVARAGHVVGGEGNGWRVAMSLLGFERGVSTLAQQIGFAEELGRVLRTAVATGAAGDPVVRDRLVRAWAELRTMRWNALRTLGGSEGPGSRGRAGGSGGEGRRAWRSCCGAAGTGGSVNWRSRCGGRRGGGSGGPVGRAALRTGRRPAPVPLQPGRHDLRRLGRDPAHDHRRARARPAEEPRGRP